MEEANFILSLSTNTKRTNNPLNIHFHWELPYYSPTQSSKQSYTAMVANPLFKKTYMISLYWGHFNWSNNILTYILRTHMSLNGLHKHFLWSFIVFSMEKNYFSLPMSSNRPVGNYVPGSMSSLRYGQFARTHSRSGADNLNTLILAWMTLHWTDSLNLHITDSAGDNW